MDQIADIIYVQNEVVWAKIRGYPWWPAYITSFSKKQDSLEYVVNFFGDTTHALLPSDKLAKFQQNFAQYQMKAKTSKKLAKSISQAEQYLHRKGLILDLLKKPVRRASKVHTKSEDLENEEVNQNQLAEQPKIKKFQSKKETLPKQETIKKPQIQKSTIQLQSQLLKQKPSGRKSQSSSKKQQSVNQNSHQQHGSKQKPVAEKILKEQNQLLLRKTRSFQVKQQQIKQKKIEVKKQESKIEIKIDNKSEIQRHDKNQKKRIKNDISKDYTNTIQQKSKRGQNKEQQKDLSPDKKNMINKITELINHPPALVEYLSEIEITVDNVKQILDTQVIRAINKMQQVQKSIALQSKLRELILHKYGLGQRAIEQKKPMIPQKKQRPQRKSTKDIKKRTILKLAKFLKSCYNCDEKSSQSLAIEIEQNVYDKDQQIGPLYKTTIKEVFNSIRNLRYSNVAILIEMIKNDQIHSRQQPGHEDDDQ